MKKALGTDDVVIILIVQIRPFGLLKQSLVLYKSHLVESFYRFIILAF